MCVEPTAHGHHWRRRSADVGGLHLATEGGHGQGWIGPGTGELQTRFAELLSDMYTQTLNAVNEHSGDDFNPDHLPKETRSRLIKALDSWHFEPHKLPEDEVLACTLILFEALFRIEGIREIAKVSMEQISALVHHLRRIYRLENSYHNFEHALDVLQATQTYLRAAGLVPPLSILRTPGRMWRSTRVFDSGPLVTSLGLIEIFTLYIAAIGHDVGHPGFTNLFMMNAQTPLSLVFDHKSALEQMHCQLLLRVMRQHGLSLLLDDPTQGHHFRKILWSTVMATDMSVHKDFMERFTRIIAREPGTLCQRQTIICQAVMKCADISNPSRPFPVSEYWAWALGQEWTSQALLEQSLDIDQTVKVSEGPLSEANSQVFFITHFAKPLLDLTVMGIPELKRYARECALNLERWTKRKSELESPPSPNPSNPSPPSSSTSASSTPSLLPSTPTRAPPSSSTYHSAFPLTLPPAKPTPHWPSTSSSSSSSVACSSAGGSGSSDAGAEGSNPVSPVESVVSFGFSVGSEGGAGVNEVGAGNGFGNGNGALYLTCDHASIRAAGKLSVRQTKKVNRNSWCPTASPSFIGESPASFPSGPISSSTTAAGTGYAPPPPSAPPALSSSMSPSRTVVARTPPPPSASRAVLPPPPASAPSPSPNFSPSTTTQPQTQTQPHTPTQQPPTLNHPQTRSSVQLLVSTSHSPKSPTILTTATSPVPSSPPSASVSPMSTPTPVGKGKPKESMGAPAPSPAPVLAAVAS